MQDGTKHNTIRYARKRIQTLEARISETMLLPPRRVMADGKTTAGQRLRLDQTTLARWKRRLDTMLKEEPQS